MLRTLTSITIFSFAATSVGMILLSLLSKHTLQDRDLAIDQHLFLFSLQFATWSLVSILLMTVYSWLPAHLPRSRTQWANSCIRGGMVAGLFAATGAYVLAWLFLFTTGIFPGIDTFFFMTCNFAMLWQYFICVEPAKLRAVILSVPLLIAAIWWVNLWLTRFAKKMALGKRQFVVVASMSLI